MGSRKALEIYKVSHPCHPTLKLGSGADLPGPLKGLALRASSAPESEMQCAGKGFKAGGVGWLPLGPFQTPKVLILNCRQRMGQLGTCPTNSPLCPHETGTAPWDGLCFRQLGGQFYSAIT